MKEFFSSALAVSVFIAWMAGPAQAARVYVSGELGVNFWQPLDTERHDTDRASVCDEYINPNYATIANCTGPDRGSDSVRGNHFGADEDILFGMAFGYYFADPRFRVEFEYFASETSLGGGDVRTNVVEEIVRVEEHIGDLSSHNLFANVYYDFANDSRFTPYIGFGLGLGLIELEYSGVFEQDIAGESEGLSDTLFGYQMLLGADYAVTESVLLGVKGRWVQFNSFRDEDDWDQLRSYLSNLRLDGSEAEAVTYAIETDGIEMFGASLNLKYLF